MERFSMTQFWATEARHLVRCLVYNVLLVLKHTFLSQSRTASNEFPPYGSNAFIIPAHLGPGFIFCLATTISFPQACRTKIQDIMDRISIYSHTQFSTALQLSYLLNFGGDTLFCFFNPLLGIFFRMFSSVKKPIFKSQLHFSGSSKITSVFS